MGLDKLIAKVEAVDEHHVRFTLSQPNAAFVADWAMDFASILSAEYADAMLKRARRNTSTTGRSAPGHLRFSSISRIR